MQFWNRIFSYRPLRGLVSMVAFCALFSGTALCAAYGQEAGAQPPPATPPVAEPRAPSLADATIDQTQAIKPNFRLGVTVTNESEPSGEYVVDQSGSIGVRYAGNLNVIRVAGFSPRMAAEEIAKVLKTYIKNPIVNITITGVPRPVIFIFGQPTVLKISGPIGINVDTTLVEALYISQFSDLAELTRVQVSRLDKDGKRITKTYNIQEYIKPKMGLDPDENQNPILQDKDRIFVGTKAAPQSGSFVAVTGEVLKPQEKLAYRSSPAMTVREAISQAGGVGPNADRRKVFIRRANADQPLVIDLEMADQGDTTNNVELLPDDSVYVSRLMPNAFYYISGGIAKPGKMVYERPLTLTQAIMEQGGPLPFAKMKEGRVFRHTEGDGDPKKTKIITFNLRDIERGKKPDIAIMPGDTIWIAPGAAPTRPPWDIFQALNFVSQVTFIYNQLSGRGFGFNGAAQ